MVASLLPPFIFFSFLLHLFFFLVCLCIMSNFLLEYFNVKDIQVITQGSWGKHRQTVTVGREQGLCGGGIFKLSVCGQFLNCYEKYLRKPALLSYTYLSVQGLEKPKQKTCRRWWNVWAMSALSSGLTPAALPSSITGKVKLGKQIPSCYMALVLFPWPTVYPWPKC